MDDALDVILIDAKRREQLSPLLGCVPYELIKSGVSCHKIDRKMIAWTQKRVEKSARSTTHHPQFQYVLELNRSR
ncbi:MAG: hypothetical protein AUG08_01495 [Acidobacteria bacterium 13_1_20CM_2_55_15]|nr:MAG: hypothetical protein AUI45_00655 [Acidobacteria bacterium 13_1_40CM_2_56_11]OLE90128.1 MAG: hypothetical protein AUG08_01495 [Acidobacteria bacterium 13_1_20CM_2_55_15]